MFRSNDRRREGSRDAPMEDNLARFTEEEDHLSDDDNAAPDMQSEAELEGEKEDPLLLALDDLEGRVVTALDDVKVHAGVRSGAGATVQEELAGLLRPVLEVAAHTAPSVARTYYRGVGAEGVEASCEDVYQRVVSDLTLPVLLEMAQSDTVPAKRGVALEFFRQLWKECHKPGSWLDPSPGANAGPYGSGQVSKHRQPQNQPRPQWKRRQAKRLAREGEILRYWVQASIACTLPGVFTNQTAEEAIAARGVIAASASLRPSFKHIAQRIRDADDRGANRIFGPVLKMVEGVLKRLFLNEASGESGGALRSSCLKFLEIVCLCCSFKPQDASQRRRVNTPDDFSLEDLPEGHPIITRGTIQSISEYAFAALRGLVLFGGQVKMDTNLLADLATGGNNTPTERVVSILKPAALAYLDIEATLPRPEAEDAVDFQIDRPNLEFDFRLDHKSYALTINAVAAVASNRPTFFREGATCLARRAADPPVFVEGGPLSKQLVLVVQAQVKATCLTLLRNALSVETKSSSILHKCLAEKCDMEIQADKALKMAQQTNALKTAGRAARHRANMFYEWETSADNERNKRQRETDDALAKMRAARASRGLGHGIQLPTSMVDAIELILANLTHLPSQRPAGAASKKKTPVTFDSVVDAVITNGASLVQEEGRWYSRDGGTAWTKEDNKYALPSKLLEVAAMDVDETKSKEDRARSDQKKTFFNQCQTASSDAVGRIVVSGLSSRSQHVNELASNIAARLAWALQNVPAPSQLKETHNMALDSIESAKKRIEVGSKTPLDKLASSFPLVASCLALEATSSMNLGSDGKAASRLSNSILNEAYVQDGSTFHQGGQQPDWKYNSSLDVMAGCILHASERANDKASDADRKRVAVSLTSNLQKELGVLPLLTESALNLVGAMCDIDDITKKAAEAARKQSQESIAASAALHAAKQAAERRATAALLVLRDTAFQRTNATSRKSAVKVAVALAAGKFGASPSCEEKALKLVMNVLYPRSETLAEDVIEACLAELKSAADVAVAQYEEIQMANKEAKEKESANDHSPAHPFAPASDAEKEALDKARKPATLVMALCMRRPEIFKKLFEYSSTENADVLSKAVRQQMPKLARAVGTQLGQTEIALRVAGMVSPVETPILLSFLDNLAPLGEKGIPPQEFIDACFKIQEEKAINGKKDPRYLIPVLSGMARDDLVSRLPEFVSADDSVFMDAIGKMQERLGRHALIFREDPEENAPSLKGMTACEQLVFLHKLDFQAAGLPQKQYLDAIRQCLDNDDMFSDSLVVSALDHMSGEFLTGVKLPLAFMRTIILVCSKHESLHSWICHTLLPRLVEGKIYEDKRQWEGWMRCAKILEQSSGGGASSADAVNKLPPEQYALYKARYG
eukprot:Nitzschia sp. Nitz4//scaffold20_size174350//44533//48770//NITZ4_002089-RA/size174350-processed-gene-0.12-mRNA-1//1//CDS//3329541770//980//frame0